MDTNTKPRPTQDRLKELFHYDAELGIFTRRQQARTWTSEDRKHGKVGAGRISSLGYVMISVDAVNYNSGLLALLYVNGEWPKGRIKYLNGNKTDNRVSNILVHDKDPEDIKSTALTLGRLKELLYYEPDTGWFTWRVASSVANIGDRAGTTHGKGYRSIGIDYKKYLEHILAWFYMTGDWPEFEIDHINRVRNDNRWLNLRDATKSENSHNSRSATRRSRTGYQGVYPHGGWFRARIHIEKETIDLGQYSTIAEARVARLLSELKNFGKLTSYNEELDTKIPAINGRTVNIQDCDKCILLIDENDIPHTLWNVSLITQYVASMATTEPATAT
jgi:hypothetical protein